MSPPPTPVLNSGPILPPTGIPAAESVARGGSKSPRLQRGAPRGTPLARVLAQSPAAASFSPSRRGWPRSPRGAVVTSGLGAGDRHGLTWVSAPVLPGCWQRSRWQPAPVPTGRGAPGRAQPRGGGAAAEPGFSASGPDPSCSRWKSMLGAHLPAAMSVTPPLVVAGSTSSSAPPSLIKMCRLSN